MSLSRRELLTSAVAAPAAALLPGMAEATAIASVKKTEENPSVMIEDFWDEVAGEAALGEYMLSSVPRGITVKHRRRFPIVSGDGKTRGGGWLFPIPRESTVRPFPRAENALRTPDAAFSALRSVIAQELRDEVIPLFVDGCSTHIYSWVRPFAEPVTDPLCQDCQVRFVGSSRFRIVDRECGSCRGWLPYTLWVAVVVDSEGRAYGTGPVPHSG